MKVLFGASDFPEEIKDEKLFKRLISESVDVSDDVEETIDDLTGLFDGCYTVKLFDGEWNVNEIVHVQTDEMASIAYGEYEILDKE